MRFVVHTLPGAAREERGAPAIGLIGISIEAAVIPEASAGRRASP